MKGIILAGGSGTRLHPLTKSISKQILPVYDKPMIYYPLSVLMLAGIQDILLISTGRDIRLFQDLLGSGEQLGISLQYAVQEQPRGLAEAFLIGEEFIGTDQVCMILGDNIFYGQSFGSILEKAVLRQDGATIFGCRVQNPSAYGVVEFDSSGKAVALEEKPLYPRSHYAVPGLYFYDNQVIEIAKGIKPSRRGEIEITDVNLEYLRREQLNVERFGRGMAWLDTGTPESLLEAANLVETVQKRQGLYVACIEEIAFNKGYITREQLLELARPLHKLAYGQYLSSIAEEANQSL